MYLHKQDGEEKEEEPEATINLEVWTLPGYEHEQDISLMYNVMYAGPLGAVTRSVGSRHQVSRVTSRVSRVTSPVSRVTSPGQSGHVTRSVGSRHQISRVTSRVSRVTSQVSRATSRVSQVTSPVSRVTSRISQVTSPVSRVTSPVSRVTLVATLTVARFICDNYIHKCIG